ncbi:MAG: hypothetical protein Kow00123_13700 [Anaerolineales bacterium]
MPLSTGNGVTHIHGDHLGSATNTTGPNAATQRYFPWGARRSTTQLPTPYRFTGRALAFIRFSEDRPHPAARYAPFMGDARHARAKCRALRPANKVDAIPPKKPGKNLLTATHFCGIL